ncbi:acyl- dehydrogenase [Leptolyngbya sp. Heron Island J]|uniref:acyl-CoA dehydrogenase n=1 Tax=Leptolyngbya sp. Heron Island J TaxID=1385935 RepID=UPI0003B954B1|nr:acyl-CoA dehydrogenase [Leptolyngbya sp. Heron Island J]ESA34883.1 acyl- dehydrogenase [Leptolyngbya sp. Heron Island J]
MSPSVVTHPAVQTLLQTLIAPQAAQLDREPMSLHRAFQALGSHGCLGLKASKEWGGQAWEAQAIYEFTEQLARYSGALVFLQSQHQRCVQELSNSDNLELKQKYLRAAISGRIGLGVGFSHLRRKQQPVMAQETAGGYVFNGMVPWITGFGIFQHWMLAAQLPDGRAVFVLAPFHPVETALTFSEPMQLAALASTQTVTATLQNWLAPQALVLDIKPPGWIQTADRGYPLTHNCFALGCAQGGLDILAKAQSSALPAIGETYKRLSSEVNQCREATYRTLATPSAERLRLRAWAIDLAVRCGHGAVIVSRGAANFSDHPAQRVYREALAFSVSGQSNQMMHASLTQLARL